MITSFFPVAKDFFVPQLPSRDFAAAMVEGITKDATDTVAELLQENHIRHHCFLNDRSFNSHLAHSVLVNFALGASSEQLRVIYKSQALEQRPIGPILKNFTTVDWKSELGNRMFHASYLDFFRKEVTQLGRLQAIVKYAFDAAVIGRTFSGAFHPLIHLGYSIDFGIDAMAAEGLALTAVTSTLLAPEEKEEEEERYGYPNYETSEDIGLKAKELYKACVMLAGGTGLHNGKVKQDFYMMHMLTSVLFVYKLVQVIPPGYAVSCLKSHLGACLAYYISRGRPSIDIEALRNYKGAQQQQEQQGRQQYQRQQQKDTLQDSSTIIHNNNDNNNNNNSAPDPWSSIIQQAMVNDDVHITKVVRSCVYGDLLFGAKHEDEEEKPFSQLLIQRTMASTTNGGSNNSNNNNNTTATATAAGSGTLQALKPNVVDQYWNDIAQHFREPGFSTFDKEKSKHVVGDPVFMRKLLLAVITDRPGQGDILPSVIAKSCCDFFTSLDKSGKTEFLQLLAKDFGVLQEDVSKAAQQYSDQTKHGAETKALLRAEQVLRHAIVPGHNKFFDRVSRLPGGLKFLIDMRQDLLTILGENRTDFYLAALNESLKEKLQMWFVGFLDLERLTWQSPAVLLEKITQYEAVHKFKDVQDLKTRVGPGRRVFALMNKSLPTEPLVFVQVALVKSLSNNVQDILNDPSPSHANPAETVKCAIFYSITTQVGLSGIELGNFLIKRVVRSLKVEFPQIETFSTLSPIPGFRRWIAQCQGLGKKLLLPDEETLVSQIAPGTSSGGGNRHTNIEERFKALLERSLTFSDNDKMDRLRPILTRLCGRYILLEKRRHLALDPVANFHLRNGACAHRLNWMGDTSSKGMEESFGLMINYLYSLDHIEMNNQQYLQDGTISVSLPDGGFQRVVQDAHALEGHHRHHGQPATATSSSSSSSSSSSPQSSAGDGSSLHRSLASLSLAGELVELDPVKSSYLESFATEAPALQFFYRNDLVFPRLRTLNVFWVLAAGYLPVHCVADFLDRHPDLRHFEFSILSGHQTDFGAVVAAIKRHPGLAFVRLDCDLVNQQDLVCQILEAIQNLESFELNVFGKDYQVVPVSEQVCRQMLGRRKMVKMRHLSLYLENPTSENAVVNHILPCCPNLESLGLNVTSYCPATSYSSMPHNAMNIERLTTLIRASCPELKKLRFCGKGDESYDLVRACGDGLESLEIESQTTITIPLMSVLAPIHTQTLTSLLLTIAFGPDPETHLDILCSCPNLVTFHSHVLLGARAPFSHGETHEESLIRRMQLPWVCKNLQDLMIKFIDGVEDPILFPRRLRVDHSFSDDTEEDCNKNTGLRLVEKVLERLKQKMRKPKCTLLDRYLEHLVTEIGKLTQLQELKILTVRQHPDQHYQQKKVTLLLSLRKYLGKLSNLRKLHSVFMEHGTEDEARWMMEYWPMLLHVGGFIGTKDDDLPRLLTQWKPDFDIQYKTPPPPFHEEYVYSEY
ncbi:hypothetical protein BG004_004648 [Podila humilis]|nr:hypothetical protein BG004_004648 [Podila humilis]